jgi:AraC family transcriptional regulator
MQIREVSGKVIGSYRAGGMVLSEHVFESGAQFDRHAHAENLLSVVLSGHYRETMSSGAVEDCRARSVRYLPAGETHADSHLSKTGCLVVRLDPRILERAREHSAVIERPGDLPDPMVRLLGARLYREFRLADTAAELAIEAIVYEMLVDASRSERSTRGRDPAWLRTADELLRTEFASPLSIQEIANAAGVHPVHLCREFRKRYGCTVGEQLRRLRVERACSLLLEGALGLAEIASRCGFCDQSHFSSVFKKMVGMTPGEFRASAA